MKNDRVFYVTDRVSVIRKILKNVIIIVARYSTDDKFGPSKPCKQCCQLMKNLEVKAVIYSANDQEFIYEKINTLCNQHMSIARRTIDK